MEHFTPIKQAKHHQGMMELVQEGHLFLVGINLSKYHPDPKVWFTTTDLEEAQKFFEQLESGSQSMSLNFTSQCSPRF